MPAKPVPQPAKAGKCPVCDYDLPADAPAVKVDGREVRVCCQECADQLRKGK